MCLGWFLDGRDPLAGWCVLQYAEDQVFCMVGVIFRWRPVSHGVRKMLGLCVLRTVSEKVLPAIVLCGLCRMSDVGDSVP